MHGGTASLPTAHSCFVKPWLCATRLSCDFKCRHRILISPPKEKANIRYIWVTLLRILGHASGQPGNQHYRERHEPCCARYEWEEPKTVQRDWYSEHDASEYANTERKKQN
jgi:hypothetical protein